MRHVFSSAAALLPQKQVANSSRLKARIVQDPAVLLCHCEYMPWQLLDRLPKLLDASKVPERDQRLLDTVNVQRRGGAQDR